MAPDKSDTGGMPDKAALEHYLQNQLNLELERDGNGSATEQAAAISAGAMSLVLRRRPAELRVRVINPAPNRTLIEALLPDQPFVVDTFRLQLRKLGLSERKLLHKVLALEREEDGTVVRFGSDQTSAREAYLYAEIPVVNDDAKREEISQSIADAFEDLHHVVAHHGRMVKRVRKHTADVEYASRALGIEDSGQEIMDFLSWLVADNYVFLGYRWYNVERKGDEWAVGVDHETGLGQLRETRGSRFGEVRRGSSIPDPVRRRLEDRRLIFFDKSRSDSTIHRAGRLDCVSIKVLDDQGRVSGFGRFVGLFTHKAIKTRASEIPIVRRRRASVLEGLGAEPGSHDFKAAIEAFDSLPPEFLLGFEQHNATGLVERVLQVAEHGGVETAAVSDALNRSFFVSVILPRPHYDEELRHQIHELLSSQYRANYIEDRTSFVDDDVALIHFFCTSEEDLESGALDGLRSRVRELAARWDDQFDAEMQVLYEEDRAFRLISEYGPAFEAEYRKTTPAKDACRDVFFLERIRAGTTDAEVECFSGEDGFDRLKIYLRNQPYLTDLLPQLDHCGLRVVDASLAELSGLGPASLWIVTCRHDGVIGGDAENAGRILEGVRAVLSGAVESDSLNRLLSVSTLSWPEVDLLRAYFEYAEQLGIAPQRDLVSATLQRYYGAARALVALFRARFDPDPEADATRSARESKALAELQVARGPIPTADEDRVVALFEELILATTRTNFFALRRNQDHAIVLKLNPALIREAAHQRLYAEIFVHAADLSGVHLRGGPIARGGIRWSDRIGDFRDEILGLFKTQLVKNGLIVPVGAKGGFVLKRKPSDREALRAELERQYVRFMACLLSVTDNVVEGEITQLPGVVKRDADDPYLVVAADRGTAHLSDRANAVSCDAGFWLGDAFASGGSHGYDHKIEGITARGAWVCARRQFLELGIDVERQPFTMAGIGDMSGDVFGNGMLLARNGLLLAAFNHEHVFLDPHPDFNASVKERLRLYELANSSWQDYDVETISSGGGVFDRNAKAIALSDEVRAMLDLSDATITGEQLVSAVLKMQVDLLWIGGIGTYVKGSDESNLDVADRANDAVRVNGNELRTRVIGEGGNLGLTQPARIEFALRGGQLNIDAIDNSGGVDLSDHEVNFKILLASRQAAEALDESERSILLRGCSEAANAAVLSHNDGQCRCISLDLLRARKNQTRMSHAADFLARRAGLVFEDEYIPDADHLRARLKETGQGYTKPELAVLLGYTKLLVKRELVGSSYPDSPVLEPLLQRYFPEALRELFPASIADHPLRREITATQLTNCVIDRAGVTMVPELCGALGVGVADVVSAYYTVDRLLQADHLRFLVAEGEYSEDARLEARLRIENAVRAAARARLGLERKATLELEELGEWTGHVRNLREVLEQPISDRVAEDIEKGVAELVEFGIHEGLARDIEGLGQLADSLGVLALASASKLPLPSVVSLHHRIGEAASIVWLRHRLSGLDRRAGWDRVAAESLDLDMLGLQRELTARVLTDGRPPNDAFEAFLKANAGPLGRILETVEQVSSEGNSGLSPLTLIAQHIRRLGA